MIIFDGVNNNKGTREGGKWVEKSAILHVSGLMPVTDGSDVLLASAWAEIQTAGYGYGSVHPDYSGLYLLEPLEFSATSKTSVDVDVTYRRQQYTESSYVNVRGGVSVVSEKTNKDKTGSVITVSYKENSTAAAVNQVGMVDVMIPAFALEFSKTQTANPVSTCLGKIGRVNSDTFQGAGAGYWLCADASFSTADGGSTWDVSFKFIYSNKKWQQTVYYVGETGRPPRDWNEDYNSNCVKEVEVYGEAVFGTLGLPVATSL